MKGINFKIVAKVAVTCLFLYLLVKNVDIGSILENLSSISPFYVLFLVLINIVMVTISCIKWQIFLRATATDVPIRILIVYYYIGYFFNNLLPSSIGGDVARMYLLGKNMKDHTKSISTVFLERYTGVIALITLAIAAAALNNSVANQPAIMIPLAVMAAVMIGSLIFFCHEGIKTWIFRLFEFKFLSSIKNKFDGFYQSVHYFRNQWIILGYSMLYSFAFHAMTIVNTLVTCWAMGIYPDIYDLAVTVPIILFVSMLPITIGSIGLWEVTFAYFFLQVGIPSADGVAVALILRAVTILMGLLGGVFYLFRDQILRHSPPPEAESEIRSASE